MGKAIMLAIALSVPMLAACAGPAVAAVSLPDGEGFPDPGAFPGAAALLAGVDAATAAPWAAGDEVLFGLELRRHGGVRRWLLHVRLTEPVALARSGDEVPPLDPLPPVQWTLAVNGQDRTFASARCRVLATVCDADGRVLGRSEPLLPRDFLATGFTAACAAVARRHGRGEAAAGAAPHDAVPFTAATVAAIALLQVVQEDSVLAPLLWEVIEPPSVWSVVSHLGAKVVLQPRFEAARPVPFQLAGPTTAWRVPVGLAVNGEPALATQLYAVAATTPLALCGGIVGAVARHPHEAGRQFALVLLAARRARRARGPTPSRAGTAGKSRTGSCR